MIIIIGFQYIVAMYIVGNISKFAKKNPFRAIAHWKDMEIVAPKRWKQK
jgi:glycerol uptake facilitator-like aquaporin